MTKCKYCESVIESVLESKDRVWVSVSPTIFPDICTYSPDGEVYHKPSLVQERADLIAGVLAARDEWDLTLDLNPETLADKTDEELVQLALEVMQRVGKLVGKVGPTSVAVDAEVGSKWDEEVELELPRD